LLKPLFFLVVLCSQGWGSCEECLKRCYKKDHALKTGITTTLITLLTDLIYSKW